MNNPFEENEKCFACDKRKDGIYRCRALDVEECPGKSCSTYKTMEMIKIQKDACEKRIASLPRDEREYIQKRWGYYR